MTKKRKNQRIALKKSFSKFTNQESYPVELDIESDENEDQHIQKQASWKHNQQSSGRTKRKKTEGSSSATIHSREADVNENTESVIYDAAFVKDSIQFMTASDNSGFVDEPPMSVFPESSKAAQSGSTSKGKEKVADVDVTDATTTDFTDINVAATSGKKKKGKKNVSKVSLKSIRTRTSPRSLSTAIKQLSEVQITCVKEMGLGALLDIDLDHIPGVLGYYVVDKLDTSSMTIQMKHGVLEFNKEGIERVFNLPSAGDVIVKSIDQSIILSESRWWAKHHVDLNVSTNHIVDRLSSNKFADWLFKVDFSMLFLTSMIESSSNGRCIKAYIPFFTKDLVFSSIDWCGTIVKCMKECTNRWKRNDKKKNYLGPLPIMILYYVSSLRSECIPPTLYNIGFKGWSSKTLQERHEFELAGGGFGLFEYVGGATVSTDDVNAGDKTNNTETTEEANQTNADGAINNADEPHNIHDTVSKLEELLQLVKNGCENFNKVFKIRVDKHNFQCDLMNVYNKFKETIKLNCECSLRVGSDDDTTDRDDRETEEADAAKDDENNDKDK